jgi:hypothetical protein
MATPLAFKNEGANILKCNLGLFSNSSAGDGGIGPQQKAPVQVGSMGIANHLYYAKKRRFLE